MFTHSGISPTAPASRATNQTSLESYSRPSTRLARKEARVKRPGEATLDAHSGLKSRREVGSNEAGPSRAKVKVKGKSKQKVTESRGAPRAPGSDCSEDDKSNYIQAAFSEAEAGDPAVGNVSKHTICSLEEGRLYLEEEALIDLGEHIDLDTITGTLVQVSLMEGIPAPVGLAVCAVALILAQMKTELVMANSDLTSPPAH